MILGLFEQFPYANFHELNLQWLMAKIKELESKEPKDYDEIIAEILRRLSIAEENIVNNFNTLNTAIENAVRVENNHYIQTTQNIMNINIRLDNLISTVEDLLQRVVMLETKVNVMYFHVVTMEDFEHMPHLPNHQYWVYDDDNLQLWLGDRQLTFRTPIYRTVLTTITNLRYQTGRITLTSVEEILA